MIQRYEIDAYFDGTGVFGEESDDGEWVKWEDISSMLDKLEELANNPYLSADANGYGIAEIIGRELNP